MKKVIFLISAFIFLIACATPYQRAKKASGNGYFDTKLQEGMYEVSFSGNEQTTITQANDFALLRSAEVCLENGYRSFEIVNKLDGSEDAASLVTTKAAAAAVTVANIFLTDAEVESKPKIILIVRCSKGADLSFKAQELKDNLKAKYNLP